MCIGTGPSLTLEQIDVARQKGFRLFGCNRVFQIVPDLELLYGCNVGFWDEYWPEASTHRAEKWTVSGDAALRYGINLIQERGADGLSLDRNVIHHGHGSGFSLVSMAWRARPAAIILLGYDLTYGVGYNGRTRTLGAMKRHYFGEYSARLQHWPSVSIDDQGRHVELCRLYQTVADQKLVTIINCTPGSVLDAFMKCDIGDL